MGEDVGEKVVDITIEIDRGIVGEIADEKMGVIELFSELHPVVIINEIIARITK